MLFNRLPFPHIRQTELGAPKPKWKGKNLLCLPPFDSRRLSRVTQLQVTGSRLSSNPRAPGGRDILQGAGSPGVPGWVLVVMEHPSSRTASSRQEQLRFPPLCASSHPIQEKDPGFQTERSRPRPQRGQRRRPPGRWAGGAGGARARPHGNGRGPRAPRPLPWERTRLGRPRGKREATRRRPSERETLSQDGVCEAAGCGVSAPRRGPARPPPPPSPPPPAAPPPRPAGPAPGARMAASGAGWPRARGSALAPLRLTAARQ